MKAIYAGSFDLITNGHLDIIRKAAKIFDEVVVLVANNSDKTYIATADLRVELIEQCFLPNQKVVIVEKWDGLTIDYCKDKMDYFILIRGLRDVSDMIAEMRLADINKELSGIDTLFIPCSNNTRNISSSMVKELCKNGYDISKYVPDHIENVLKFHFSNSEYI